MSLALVSQEILLLWVRPGFAVGIGLLLGLLAAVVSVRTINLRAAVARPSSLEPPASTAERQVEPVEPEAPAPPRPYLAFSLGDDREGTTTSKPTEPAPPVASAPLAVVESVPEVAWIRSLVSLGFHDAVETFKRRLLEEAISLAEGNRAEAARRLGLQRTYLYRLARQLGAQDVAVGDRPSAN